MGAHSWSCIAHAPGLLTVVEQIPGLVEYADLTDTLERGYWPRCGAAGVCVCLIPSSYNVPYFKEVYERSGCVLFFVRVTAHCLQIPRWSRSMG